MVSTAHPTKSPIDLYYRDPIECLQSIFHSPLVADYLDLVPFRLFKSAKKLMRIYTEWLSANSAWNMQVMVYVLSSFDIGLTSTSQERLPPGATVLGTILSSDKTNISVMTGDRISHPLLISLANLRMDFHMKSSNNTFVLLVLLPVPKFIHQNKKARGVLEYRLTHECLDIVLEPLKIAARIGIMMSDPWGGSRYCFTPLAGYIMDFQEAVMIAGVGGKMSPITMAMYKDFGDLLRHEPRTASKTAVLLAEVRRKADPNIDLLGYIDEAGKLRLSGVSQLFWHNWPLADPQAFLTPEPLHHWHKMFWDHDAKWCIHVLGNAEIDFRFSVLPPRIGFRQFKEGISKLKQVTGHEHRDVQRYLIGVIVGAAPKEFVIAVRALMDFRYLVQASVIDENTCDKIQAALATFHVHKDSIIASGGRLGKGNRPIDNWYIPKLELMQSVVANIWLNGASIQWSADITEHAHITEIKHPAHSGNNQSYDPQICRNLDRIDKCRRFDIATSLREAGIEFGYSAGSRDDPNSDEEESRRAHSTSALLGEIDPVSRVSGTTHHFKNHFGKATHLQQGGIPNAPTPFWTFAVQSTAFHLTRDPKLHRVPVDEVAKIFNLPDLRPSLANYIQRFIVNPKGRLHVPNMSSRRVARAGCELAFECLHLWDKVYMQSYSYHNQDVLPAQAVNVSAPTQEWPHGRFDTVLVNIDANKHWPMSGINGESHFLSAAT